jgi:hypothetical protein
MFYLVSSLVIFIVCMNLINQLMKNVLKEELAEGTADTILVAVGLLIVCMLPYFRVFMLIALLIGERWLVVFKFLNDLIWSPTRKGLGKFFNFLMPDAKDK